MKNFYLCLLSMLIAFVTVSCNKPDIATSGLADKTFGLGIIKAAGDNQDVPITFYTAPLVVTVSSIDGSPANGMIVDFTEETSRGATIITPSVVVTNGIAQTRAISPNMYGINFKIRATIRGTNSSVVFSLNTIQKSLNLRYQLETTNFGREVAGTNFGLNLYIKDELGNIVDINSTIPIILNVSTEASWSGQYPSWLPNASTPVYCIFVSGHCSVPVTLNLKNSLAPSLIWIGDGQGGMDDVSAQPIIILNGAGNQIALTDKLGGPSQGAVGFSKLNLNADDEEKIFYSAVVDSAGNYIEDATNVTISSENINIFPYITVDSTLGQLNYLPRKVTSGPMSFLAINKEGMNESRIDVSVTPGKPKKFLNIINGGQTPQATDILSLKILLADKNDNVCTQITDSIPLTMHILEGRRPSGINDLSLVNDEISWGTYLQNRDISSNENVIFDDVNYFFLYGESYSPGTINIRVNDKYINPAFKFSTTKTTFNNATMGLEPVVVDTPPESEVRDASNNVINKVVFSPPKSTARPHFIIFRNPQTKAHYCTIDNSTITLKKVHYTAGFLPNTLPTTLNTDLYCDSFLLSADSSPLQMEAYFVDQYGNNIDGNPNTPELDPVAVNWVATGAYAGNIPNSWGTYNTLYPTGNGIGGLQVSTTVPNHPFYENRNTTIRTHIIGSISNGEPESFDIAPNYTAPVIATSTYPIRIRALDKSGVWISGFNQTVTANLSWTGANNSPKGTAPALPTPTSLNFMGGSVLIENVYTPKAGDQVTLTVTGNFSNKTITTTKTWTVGLGPNDHIELYTEALAAGQNWTNKSFTIGINDNRDYTIFPTVYDRENNFISSAGIPCTWTTTDLNSVNLTSLLQVKFNVASPNARLGCSYGGMSAQTGNINVLHGPFKTIVFDTISKTNVKAGEEITFKFRMIDEWHNTIRTASEGGNSTRTFTYFGNNNSTIPSQVSNVSYPVTSIPFTNGQSATYSMRIYDSGTHSIGFGDQSNNEVGDAKRFTVTPNTAHKLGIQWLAGSLSTVAGTDDGFTVALFDEFDNRITSGPGSGQKINVTFSALNTLDIFSSSLSSSTSVGGTQDLSVTGHLVNGAAWIGYRSQKTGTFTATFQSVPDPENTIVPGGDPVSYNVTITPSTPASLAWKTGALPASSYTVETSTWGSFSAQLLDTYGNICTNINSGNIVLTAEGGQKTLRGTTTRSISDGEVQFDNINYLLANDSFTLTATYSANTAIKATKAVTTTVGTPLSVALMFDDTKLRSGALSLTEALNGDQMTNGVIKAGETFTVKALALDAGFNKVTTYSGQATLSASADPSISISPGGLQSFVNGERLFTVTHKKVNAAAFLTTICSLENCYKTSNYSITTSHPNPTKIAIALPGQGLSQGVFSSSTSCAGGTPTNRTAGVDFTVTVQATDDYCNYMSATNSVSLALGDALAPAVAAKNMVNGGTTFTVQNRTASTTRAITATVSPSTNFNSSSFTSATYTVVANSPVTGNSSVTGPGSNIVANGTSTATMTITIRDTYNNGVTNITPEISISGTNNNNVTCSSTNTNGIAFCSFTSTKAEVKTVSLTSPLTGVSGNVTFIADAASTATSTLVATGPVTANNVATSTITITLLDANNNPVIGTTPTFNATGTSNTYGTCSATNSSGVSTCTLRSTKAESKTPSIQTPIVLAGNSVLFVHGPATKLGFSTNTSTTATAGVNFTNQPVVVVRDQFDNTVSDPLIDAKATSTVALSTHLTSCSGTATSATLKGTTTLSTTNGVASFSGLNYEKAESIFIKATSASLTTACNTTATVVSPAGASAATSTLAVTTNNSVANNSTNNVVRITLRDAFGNLISGTTPTITVSGTGNTFSCPVSNASGISDCTIRTTKAETKTVSIATPSALSSLTAVSITFIPGAATKLAFSVQPSTTGTAGADLTTQPQVQLLDVNNNLTTSTASVTLAAFTNSGCTTGSTATLQGTTTLAAVAGTSAFTNIKHTKAETVYLKATSGALTSACSTAVAISPASPSSLAFTTQPSTTATAGTNFATQPIVTIYDAFSNIVTAASGSVTMSSVNSSDTALDSTTTLIGTTSRTPTSGVATFTGLSYQTAEVIKLKASFSGITAFSNNISVGAAGVSATTSTISATSNITANGVATSTISITLKDQYGNPISGTTPTLTVSGTGNSTPVCSPTTTNTSGQTSCTFNSTKAETKTITLGQTSQTTTTTFVPGTASKLAIATQPTSTATAGVAIGTQPVIQIQDAQSNVVTSSSDSVTLSAFTNSGCTTASTSTLKGTTTVAATSGVATFSGINHEKAETLYIKASSGSLSTVCTSLVTVSPASAAGIAFSREPSTSAIAGVAFGTQPVVKFVDAFGNFNTTQTGNIVMSTAGTDSCASSSSASLQGTTTVAASSGTATYSGLNYQKAESVRLKATYNSWTACSSANTVVSANSAVAASTLFSVSNSGTATADGTVLTVTVTLRDTYLNTINGQAITYAVAPSTGVTALTCTDSGSDGIYYCNVSSTKAEAKTFNLSTPVVTTTGPTLTFTPGAPASIAFTGQPGSSATAGSNFSPQPAVTVYDANSNVVTGASSSVDLTAVSSTNTSLAATTSLVGTASRTPTSGVAAFTGLSYQTAEAIKLKATYSSLSATSNTITVGFAGASATTSTISATSNITANGVATSTISITLKDQYGNAISGTTPTLTVSGTGNSTPVCSPTTTNTSGQTSCMFNSTKAETKTITLGQTSQTTTATFVPGPASKLAIATQPSSTATAGAAIATQPVIQIQDAQSNVVTSSSDSVTLEAFTNSGCTTASASTLKGTTTISASSGVATFSGINHEKAETLYIKASSGSLTTVCTSLVTVSPASAAGLAFSREPSTSAIAGVAFGTQPVVKFVDAFGNFNTTQTGNIVMSAAGTDNCASSSSASLQGTTTVAASSGTATYSGLNYQKAESIRLKATYNSWTACSSANTVVSPNSAVAASTLFSVSNSGTATADGTVLTVTVTLRDTYLNTINGQAITYAVAPSTGVTAMTCTDSGSGGIYYCNVSSTKADSKTFNLSTPVVTTTGPTLTFTPGTPVAATSTIAVAPSSVTANGSSLATATITLKDVNGNTVPSTSVGVTVAPSTGVSTPTCGQTNSLGVGTCTFSSTKAEAKTVTLSTPDLGLSANVTFVPGSASSVATTMTATSNVTANGSDLSTVSITLKDASGNPIPSTALTITVSGSGNSTPSCTSTNASGEGTCTFHSTKAETKTITLGQTSQTATTTFIPGAASKLAIATQPSSTATAGAAIDTQPVIEIQDAQSNVVTSSSGNVTLSAFTDSNCSTASTTTLKGTTTISASSGLATFSGINHEKAETLYIKASSGSLTTVCTTLVTVSPASAAGIAFSREPSTTATAGVAFGTQPIVKFVDAFGNYNTTQTGNIVMSAAGTDNCASSSSASLQGTTSVAASSGTATYSGLNYQKAESIRLKATYNSWTTCSSANTVVTNNVPIASNTLLSNSGSVTANGSSTIDVTVILRDSYLNRVSGESLTYSVSPSTGFSGLPCTGLGDGEYSCLISSTKAETKTFNLLTPVLTTSGTSLVFTPDAPASAYSTLSLSASSATVSTTVTATVTLKDVNNNVVSTGTSVSISVTPSTGVQNLNCGTTNASGVATCSFTSTKAEAKTVTLTDPDLSKSASVTFTAGVASAANSDLSATTNIVANGTSTSSVSITLRDASNNPVGGVTPTLSVTGSNNTVGSCSQTSAEGESTCTIASTKAEQKTITLSPTGKTYNVTFVPGAASQLSYSIQPISSGVAGITFGTQPTVQILDAHGNLTTSSSSVTLTAYTNSGCSTLSTKALSGTTTMSATSGSASFSDIHHEKAETVYLKATSGSLAATCSTSVTVAAGDPADIMFTQEPGSSATAGVNFATQPIVKFVDAFGNFNTTETGSVTFTAASTDNCQSASSETLQGSTTLSFTSGVATATDLSYEKAESIKLKAIDGSFTACSTTTITVAAASPSASTTQITAGASATANGSSQVIVTVDLKDQFNNPVEGSTLSYTVTPSTGVTTGSCSDANNDGSYECGISSTSAGSKKFNLTSPLSMSEAATLTFTSGSASGAQSTLVASPSTQTANGSSSVVVTVNLKDSFGNGISGESVALTITPATGVSGPTCGQTNASGTATCSFTSTKAEEKTITLTTPALNVSDTVTFVPGSASNAASTISVNKAIIADGTDTATISIHLEDANGNDISGVIPVLSGTISGDDVTCGSTSSLGNTTCSFTANTAGTRTIGLSAPSGITKTVSLTVHPNEANLVRTNTESLEFQASDCENGTSDSKTYTFRNDGQVATGSLNVDFQEDTDWTISTICDTSLSYQEICTATITLSCGETLSSQKTLNLTGTVEGSTLALELTGTRP